ncbi:MAG: protein phosphatase CheZ [Rhodospirillales bacterium]|nr:protein phosphatase CheZ [Rhodospirillales bacterium]
MAGKRVDVARLLSELRNKYGDTVKVEDVAKVMGTLLASNTGELAGASRKIYTELEALNRYIQSAKAEISALRPDEVTDEFLPTATGELDAIVAATAEATNAIMDATEVIEGVADSLEGAQQDSLMDATTNIYEACGFQDITGQRITKVVNTLKDIEDKVDALVTAFGDKMDKVENKAAKESQAPAAPEKLSDADLLEGPQRNGEGISQDEIDRLLAEFD